MIRIVRMSGKYYGFRIGKELISDVSNIQVFVYEGTPVILVDVLDDLKTFGINPADVEMV